jgi:hypothetical protein
MEKLADWSGNCRLERIDVILKLWGLNNINYAKNWMYFMETAPACLLLRGVGGG